MEENIKDTKFNKQYSMTIFICLLIALEGFVMTIVNTVEHEDFLKYITLSYSILMIISLLHVVLTKRFFLFYINSFIIVFYLEITFLATGGSEGFGLIWLSLIPLLGMYSLEIKPFIILNILIYLILIVCFYTPLNQFIYSYNDSFKIRYSIYFLADIILVTFIRYKITKTESNLEMQKNILSRELLQAASIQSTFSNSKNRIFKGWTIAYKNLPMAVVTGDLRDLCSTDDKLDGFGLYDISGHGISSGLLTMLLRNIIHQEFYADEECDLWETVNRINDRFIEEKEDVSNYTTGIIARIKGNKIEIVNAAHPVPVILRNKTKQMELVEKDPTSRGPIGLQGFPAIYNSQFIKMEKGDKLVLYTDGISDCKNDFDDLYGDENFFQILMNNIDSTPDEIINKVIDSLMKFKGRARQNDDISIFILQKN